MEIRPAFQGELRDIFRNVHEVWPHSDDVESHIQLRLTSQQHKYAKWYLAKDESQVVASLGAYPYQFQVENRLVQGIAIGAVHTLQSHRRKGIAGQLLNHVHQEEKRDGAKISMLYSDIAPAYYEKLGYKIQKSFHGFVGPFDHPLLSVKEETLDQFPSYSFSSGEAGVSHEEPHWKWLKRRHPNMRHLIVSYGHQAWIHVLSGFYEGKEMILDWGIANPSVKKSNYQAFQSIASYLGLEKVHLWSKGSDCPSGFNFKKPEVEIPMVKYLDESLENQISWQFQPVDHV